jgi:hypothetical protein
MNEVPQRLFMRSISFISHPLPCLYAPQPEDGFHYSLFIIYHLSFMIVCPLSFVFTQITLPFFFLPFQSEKSCLPLPATYRKGISLCLIQSKHNIGNITVICLLGRRMPASGFCADIDLQAELSGLSRMEGADSCIPVAFGNIRLKFNTFRENDQ